MKKVEQPDDKGTELIDIESKKRIAVDGSQRGLHRKGMKSKVTTLMEQCQAAVEQRSGTKNWDPVVMLAIIADEAYNGYAETDANGNAILNEDGFPLIVPPNREFAAAVLARAAPYLHGHVKPKEVGDEDTRGGDPEEKEELLRALLDNMGVPGVQQ